MTNQHRLPKTGECWRHFKGGPYSLYTVVGTAEHSDGTVNVVYTPFGAQIGGTKLFTRPIGEWMQTVEIVNMVPPIKVQRFTYERPVGSDEKCPFIRQPDAPTTITYVPVAEDAGP